MDERETVTGVVGHFYRSGNGDTRLFALTVIREGVSRHTGGAYISKGTYDVEWSKRYGYLFGMTGCGGGGRTVEVDGLFHCSGDIEIERKPCRLVDLRDKPRYCGRATRRIRRINATRRMMRPPIHIDLRHGQNLFDWLVSNGIEQDAVWCAECRDWVRGDYLCKHCWWCDKNRWYSTPSESCGHPREECDTW